MDGHGSRLSETLDLLKDTYNYNHWVYSLLRPYVGTSVLEVGAGTGNLTQFLLNSKRLVCLEPDREYVEMLKGLADVHRNVTVCCGDMLDLRPAVEPAQQFDTVVCVNVLEHIEDDARALRCMASVLRPGGRILLYIPACQWAYGALDEHLGHYRRYSRCRIKALAHSVGLVTVTNHFVNLPGVFGWFWTGCVKREPVIRVENARFVDRIVPYLSAAERLVHPPIGQSLFAVLQSP